jgi:UDP-glucose 4-epimerase
MANYLIIGGNGVIGHFLTRQLVRRGERPIVMSRSGDTTLIADIADRCDVVRCDVGDAKGVDELVRNRTVTHIAHLGAILPNVAETDPATAVRANVEGAAIVLEAARQHGVKRVVMASSKAVYGPATGAYGYPDYAPIPEDAPLNPTTVYGITKFAAEQLAAFYRRTHGLEVASVRFGATIGPGKIARHGGSFSRYSTILEGAMAGRPVSIGNPGDAICDSLFNDDVARGVLAVLDAPSIQSDVYNIATGTGFSLNDYANAVRRLYPGAQITIASGHGDASSTSCVLDVRRAKSELGFEANPDADWIVANYVESMKQLGMEPA